MVQLPFAFVLIAKAHLQFQATGHSQLLILSFPKRYSSLSLEQFIVVCSVMWPLNGSKAGGDLVFIKTSLFLLCETSCSYAN